MGLRFTDYPSPRHFPAIPTIMPAHDWHTLRDAVERCDDASFRNVYYPTTRASPQRNATASPAAAAAPSPSPAAYVPFGEDAAAGDAQQLQALRADVKLRRQRGFLRHGSRQAELAAGVWVQTLSFAELHRILEPLLKERDEETAANRAPTLALINKLKAEYPEMHFLASQVLGMSETFREQSANKVNVLWSCESLLRDWLALSRPDRRAASKAACLLLAWQPQKRGPPVLRGAMTTYPFRDECAAISTVGLSDENHQQLDDKLESEKGWMYVDVIVSAADGSGVGKALLMNAFKAAKTKGLEGVIALSYKARPQDPESAKYLFESATMTPMARADDAQTVFAYEHTMPDGDKQYGTWYVISSDDMLLDLDKMRPCFRPKVSKGGRGDEVVNICRRG